MIRLSGRRLKKDLRAPLSSTRSGSRSACSIQVFTRSRRAICGAAGAGLSVAQARAIGLTNQNGAVLELSGHQTGLMANADLSGLAITMR